MPAPPPSQQQQQQQQQRMPQPAPAPKPQPVAAGAGAAAHAPQGKLEARSAGQADRTVDAGRAASSPAPGTAVGSQKAPAGSDGEKKLFLEPKKKGCMGVLLVAITVSLGIAAAAAWTVSLW
jgi:hypothetical protein